VLAVDPERPGESDRNLRGADQVLDVAARRRRVEREARDVVEPASGPLLGELPPARDPVGRVVVLLVVGDLRLFRRLGRDGVVHLQRQLAERLRRERDGDLVVPLRQLAEAVDADAEDALERQIERRGGRDLARRHRGAVGELEAHLVEVGGDTVDGDRRQALDRRVAQPVLEHEADAAADVLEAAEGVELLQ
jgi:hypothetical protein